MLYTPGVPSRRVQLRVRNPCNRDPLVVSSVMSPIPITFEPCVFNFGMSDFRPLGRRSHLVLVPTCVRDRFRPNFTYEEFRNTIKGRNIPKGSRFVCLLSLSVIRDMVPKPGTIVLGSLV